MPASIDLGGYPLVTHNPLERLDQTLPKMPKMDLEQLFKQFIDGLKDLTGVDLSILNDILHGIGTGLDGLRRFVESLIGQALDMLHLPDPATVWRQVMGAFLNPLSWLNNIPIGAITAATPNLLADFISADSLVGNTMFVFDSAVAPAGASGSVRTTFDGTVHELISERIMLDVGRKVDAAVKIKYSGVTSPTASPIRLSWIGWNGDTEVAGGDFAVHQPSGVALDWTTLSGSLTRLESDPWDRVTVVLKTTAGATGGNVWFGAARGTKPDKLPKNLIDGLEGALAAAGQTIRDAICNALGLGGTGHTDADVIRALTNIPQTAVAGLTAIAGNLTAIAKNFFDGFFGGSHGTGTPEEVRQTAEAIKVALAGGKVLQTFTANTAWTLPAGIILTDVTGVVINAGQCGTLGEDKNNGSSAGGIGGRGGAYLAKKLDLTGLTPGVSVLDIECGLGGSTSGAVGGTSRIKSGSTVLLEGSSGAGGIATDDGWATTTSTAGNGGDGGSTTYTNVSGSVSVSVTQPTDGTSSAIATGGVRGVSRVNNSPGTAVGDRGSNGAAGTSNAVPLCGGAGGAGGGSAASTSAFTQVSSGDGGHGGFPGGAGAGAGGLTHAGNRGTRGNFGLGAHGLVALIYKTT